LNSLLPALLSLSAGLVPAQQPVLTLEEALAIAEQQAFAVRAQQTAVERSRQRVAEAQAQRGPRVTLSGTYTRFDEAQTANFGPDQPPLVIQPIDTRTVVAALNLPLDISGNLARLVQAARRQEQASRHSLRATVNDARLNTRQAYFNVLRAQGLVDVAEQTVRDAEAQLAQARQLFAADQIALVDVLRFETQVSQASADVVAARNGLQIARNAFNFTLARPIETPVLIAPIAELPATPTDPMSLVQAAQANRPEVLALEDVSLALAQIRRAREAGMNPSATVGLQHQRNLDAQGFSARASQTVGTLSVSIPVFDSGLTRAQVRQARQDEEEAQINLEQLRLGVSQEVLSSIQNLQGASARLQTAEAQVALAQEVYRLARIRQDAGVGTYVEVIDAETSLTRARNAVVAARYDYLTAYAQLQRAVGDDGMGAAPTTAPEGRN
jgi:outer membrane protein